MKTIDYGLCAHYNYPTLKSIYTLHKTNILLLCYIPLSVPESFMTFFILCDYMTCDSDMCYAPITHNVIPYPSSKSKIKLSLCYELKILELVKGKNLVLELTQENLIENSVQDHLPYIPKTNSLCSTLLAYPK